jgi:hypothetical protein
MVGLPSHDDVPDRAQVDDRTGEVHTCRGGSADVGS